MLLTCLLLLTSVCSAPLADDSTTNRRQVATAILEEAKRENKDPRSIISSLLGGGSGYAPYQMPCPTGVTWVRPADVSFSFYLIEERS